MRAVLLVALGGALGAAARYGVALWLADVAARFPWHTLAVNLVGSFALGALVALSMRDATRLLVLTGLLGGFTTFSTFSVEVLALFQSGRPVAALAYAGISVLGGVLCSLVGFGLARMATPQPL